MKFYRIKLCFFWAAALFFCFPAAIRAADSTSFIIEQPSFAYPSAINHTAYQTATITNTSNSLGVFKFIVQDKGGDGLPTGLQAVVFALGGLENIRSAALFSGNTFLPAEAVFSRETGFLSFTGLDGEEFKTPDGAQKAYTLRVSFIEKAVDGSLIVVRVAQAEADPAFSRFAAPDAGGAFSVLTGGQNRIDVRASSMFWGKQPAEAWEGMKMPSPEVWAVDVFGNVDADFAGCEVTVTSLPSLFSDKKTVFVGGKASINDCVPDKAVSSLVLSAKPACFGGTEVLSEAFEVRPFALKTGDCRPVRDGVSFSDASAWEQYNGSAWATSAQAPENQIPARLIIDRPGITAGNSCGKFFGDICVTSGGSLSITQQKSPGQTGMGFLSGAKIEVFPGGELRVAGDLDMAGAGLIVRNDGLLVLNHLFADAATEIWAGDEMFYPASETRLLAWDSRQSFLSGTLSRHAFGGVEAVFGKLTLDFADTEIQQKAFVLLPQGFSGGISHHDLELKKVPAKGFFMGEGGNASAFIGGDWLIGAGGKISVAGAGGDVSVSIKNALILESGGFCLADSLSVGANVYVGGLLDLRGGNFVLSANAGGIANLRLTGGIFSSIKIENINTGKGKIFLDKSASIQKIILKNGVKNTEIIILEEAHCRLASELRLELGALLRINEKARLECAEENPLHAFEITGEGSFRLEKGGFLSVSHAEGIWQNAGKGNIRCANRFFNQTATFMFAGQSPYGQFTGDAITNVSNGKIIVIDCPQRVVLSQSTGISSGNALDSLGGRLEIRRGRFEESPTAYIYGSGRLLMSGGVYSIPSLSANSSDLLPRLSNASFYGLTGGTVELSGGTGRQILRGGIGYFNLEMSGGGEKKLSGPIVGLKGGLHIFGEGTVADLENKAFEGAGGLRMSGGCRLRMSRLNVPLPELSGDYALEGGTIELYGSKNGQQQYVRGLAGSGNIEYHRLEINAAAANDKPGEANAGASGSFSVREGLQIKSPASFRFDETEAVSGEGYFRLDTGATLLYGARAGIKLSGTGADAGNIRVAGERRFPEGASYGFVGGNDMETGDALPQKVKALILDKNTDRALVALGSGIQVENKFVLNAGRLALGEFDLTLGKAGKEAAVLLPATEGKSFVQSDKSGKIKSFVGGAGELFFPLGSGGVYSPCSVKIRSGQKVEEAAFSARALSGAEPHHSGFASWLKRHWEIEPEGLQNYVCRVGFGYAQQDVAGDEAELRPSKWSAAQGIVSAYKNFEMKKSDNWVYWDSLAAFSHFTAAGGQLLPLGVLSLQAQKSPAGFAGLSWSLATGFLSVKYFGIERSADGITYEEIAKIKAAGAKGFYEDAGFGKNAYYKVYAEDTAGEKTYSKTAFFKGENIEVLSVYPNPGQGEIFINLPEAAGHCIGRLYGAGGETLCAAEGSLEKIAASVNGFLLGKGCGVYVLRIASGGHIWTVRVLRF